MAKKDVYLAAVTLTKGYTFDWIEGEMWEKSPFTGFDLIRQRQRWIQGIFLVVHSNKLPFWARVGLAATWYSWLTTSISMLNILLSARYPILLA